VQAMHRQVAEQAKVKLGIKDVAVPGTAEVGTAIPPERPVEPEVPRGAPRDVQRGTTNEPPPPFR
jgi:hypothetical protein